MGDTQKDMEDFFNVFTNIQLDIIQLNQEKQIELFTKCLTKLDELQTNNPKLQNIIKKIFHKKPCYFDDDTMKLFHHFISEYIIKGLKINTGNSVFTNIDQALSNGSHSMIEDVSSISHESRVMHGGEGEQDEQLSLPINQIQPLKELELLLNYSNSSNSNEAITQIIRAEFDSKIKQSEANRLQAEANLIHAKTSQIQEQRLHNNDSYDRILDAIGTSFSVLAPGPITYYVYSSCDEISTYVFNLVFNSLQSVVSTEIGAKKVVAELANTTKQLTSQLIEFVGMADSFPTLREYGKSIFDAVTPSQESAIESAGTEAIVMTEKIAGHASIIGCFIIYIILTLLLLFFFTCLSKLKKTSKIGILFGHAEFRGGNKKHKKSSLTTKKSSPTTKSSSKTNSSPKTKSPPKTESSST